MLLGEPPSTWSMNDGGNSCIFSIEEIKADQVNNPKEARLNIMKKNSKDNYSKINKRKINEYMNAYKHA